MQATELKNVGIGVRDLDEAMSFFTDVGLTVIGRDEVEHYRLRHRRRHGDGPVDRALDPAAQCNCATRTIRSNSSPWSGRA